MQKRNKSQPNGAYSISPSKTPPIMQKQPYANSWQSKLSPCYSHAKLNKGPLISMLMQWKATMQSYGETNKDHLSSSPSHHALSIKGKLWTLSPCNSHAKARNKSHVTFGQPLDKHTHTPTTRQTQNHIRPLIMQARPCKVQKLRLGK